MRSLRQYRMGTNCLVECWSCCLCREQERKLLSWRRSSCLGLRIYEV